MTKPTTSAFAEVAGISMGYASDLLNGKRDMPRSLAIHMLKTSGWQHESIEDLTDAQITMLAELEPWTPPKERAAA